MTQAVLPSGGPVPSPCTSVCALDPRTGLCAGCFRTLDEIAAWSELDDEGKRAVWSALTRRRADAALRSANDDSPRSGTDAQR
jgi:uncharacterized protein